MQKRKEKKSQYICLFGSDNPRFQLSFGAVRLWSESKAKAMGRMRFKQEFSTELLLNPFAELSTCVYVIYASDPCNNKVNRS